MDRPTPYLVLLILLLAFAAVGAGDYADAVERENRVLRASAERCQHAVALAAAGEEAQP